MTCADGRGLWHGHGRGLSHTLDRRGGEVSELPEGHPNRQRAGVHGQELSRMDADEQNRARADSARLPLG